jgi:poly(A) polymerase
MSVLLQDAGATGELTHEICRRLRMSNLEGDQIADLIASRSSFIQAKELREADLRRLLNKPNINDHLELLRAYCISSQRGLASRSFCLDKLSEYAQNPIETPLLKGEDLIEMGYRPGPIFKQILRTIEDLQLEGALKTREEALERVQLTFPLDNPHP